MITQIELIKEFFQKNCNKDIPHSEIVPWLEAQYLTRTGKRFADPDRGIRKLFQEGFLIKISKGVYRYEPQNVTQRALEDFTETQKQIIKKRDGYRCVLCGLGVEDGVELYVDHIKPKELGGKAIIENGQTLCGPHNNLKKMFKQTETGKKYFIRLYELSKTNGNVLIQNFCKDILNVYERHKINGHIKWKE